MLLYHQLANWLHLCWTLLVGFGALPGQRIPLQLGVSYQLTAEKHAVLHLDGLLINFYKLFSFYVKTWSWRLPQYFVLSWLRLPSNPHRTPTYILWVLGRKSPSCPSSDQSYCPLRTQWSRWGWLSRLSIPLYLLANFSQASMSTYDCGSVTS